MLTSRVDTFYPCTGLPVPRICVWNCATSGWASLRAEIATALECDEDELTTREIVWNDGDSSAEFVIYNGRIIGSIGVFADLITAEDWPAIFEAHRAPVDA